MVAGPLPTAGVQLVAQNLEQFKAQMREATQAITQMGSQGRQALQQMGTQGNISLGQMRNLGSGTRLSLATIRDNWQKVAIAAAGFTAGLYAVNRGLQATVGAAMRYASEVRDLSAATGAGAEETSRLLQVLDDYELTASDAAAASRALRDEGLSPTIDTLADLSDQFLAIEDPAQRADFLMEHFGRTGAGFARLMAQGGIAIRAANAAVDERLVLTAEDIQQSEELRLALDSIGDSMHGIAIAIGNDLIPGLANWAGALGTVISMHQRGQNVWLALIRALRGEAEVDDLADAGLRQITDTARRVEEQTIRTTEGTSALNAELDELAQQSALEASEALDEGAAAAGLFADHVSRLDDETLGVQGSLAGVGPAATAAFGEVNFSLADSIERMRDTAAWIAGGGLGLQMAAEQVNQALLAGQITPEQADAMFQEVEAAALSLQEDIGQITMDDATQQMAEDFGLNWGDARTQIQGARDDILNLPEQVRTQIRVDVQWNVGTRSGPPPGGQHGLNMTVPPGYPNDTFPILASSGERVIIAPAAAAAPQTMIYNNQDYSSRSIGSVNMAAGDNPYEFDRRMQRWMGY